jgi:hypothetical protein
MQALGAPVRLVDWYDDAVTVVHMAFVCGTTEEIVFVDSLGQVRVFSWVTQQFR